MVKAATNRSNVLRLIARPAQQPFNLDTVEQLERLLLDAKAGLVTGVAFTALRAGRRYEVGVSGECSRNPTFARGMLKTLDDELASKL